MEVKEPLIPEITETYVIWHPVKGYYSKHSSDGGQLLYSTYLPNAVQYHHKYLAQNHLDRMAVAQKVFDRIQAFTKEHKIRKVVTCLDD